MVRRSVVISRILLAVAALTVAMVAAPPGAVAAGGATSPTDLSSLGPNVIVLDPSMPTSQIQATVDAVAAQQVDDQFGTGRYALLFEPGTYGADVPLVFQVGYYTEVAGLGRSPGDVVIHGAVDVHNQCDDGGCTALVNFWRSLSNLTIDPAGQTGCRTATEFWAVSQAAPMRRVHVNGAMSLMDYCTAGPQFASGGFIADSAISGNTVNGSQQQFIVRDSSLNGWSNGVWNQVFAGVDGAPAQAYPNPPYTTLPTDPASRERPYLYVDETGSPAVFVPAPHTDSHGTTWANGATPGHSLPLSSFFVASPSDSVEVINDALSRGKNLLLTPGMYDVSQTIKVKRADTVVLGLGFPTLTPENGAVAMSTADVAGIDIAGLMIDAGPVSSPALLRIGNRHAHKGEAADPAAVQDVFFRIGGPHIGKADVSLEVNSDHTLLDDIWAWRADHGAGVGWTENTARTGVVVNGDDVTATGLFVEHYQGYDVVWNGQGGETIMFQNEMPYDPPDQASWQHDGVLGFAAYKVADGVTSHEGYGLGSYIFTNVNPALHASHAFEVPVTPGVRLHDVLTVSLNKAGTIDHVVNDTGGPVTPAFAGPSTVVSFP
ncbi:MAG TPA: adenylyl cyclase [Actinomycetes bacterium]